MMKPLAPELLARFKAAVGPAGECARRACRSAWEHDDKGEPVGLLPAPAGEDEARIRYPLFFNADKSPAEKVRLVGGTGGAVAGPNGSGTIPPGVPTADDTGAADKAAAYWAAVARGSLPEPFGELAAEAIEACGRTAENATLIPGAPACEKLERMGQSPEWAALPPTRQSLVISLLASGAKLFPGVVAAALGTPGKPPLPLPVENDDAPDTLADVKVETAQHVAAGLLFAGRLGLIHGPAGGGKTTVLANALARVTSGRPWLGQPVKPGAVVLCCEEATTYAAVFRAAGGNPSRVYLRRWRDLTAALEELRPVALIVDTFQFVNHEIGGGELDSAQAVDAILRPLERLCRDSGCAVLITDHEPHADQSGRGGDRDTGTIPRPRHSGAKAATADYLIRVTTADGVTTIARGAKVRWGIAIEPAVHVDISGERVKAPAGTATADPMMDGAILVTDWKTYQDLLTYLRESGDVWRSTGTIRQTVTGRGAKLLTALDQLVAAGRIERRIGPHNSTQYRAVAPSETAETVPPQPDPVAAETAAKRAVPAVPAVPGIPGTAENSSRTAVPTPEGGNGGTGTGHGNGSEAGNGGNGGYGTERSEPNASDGGDHVSGDGETVSGDHVSGAANPGSTPPAAATETGGAATNGDGDDGGDQGPAPPDFPAANPESTPPAEPEENQPMPEEKQAAPGEETVTAPEETPAARVEDAPPVEEVTPPGDPAVADIFNRGAAVRASAERAGGDGDPPAGVAAMQLSDNPKRRRAGRRLELLDHTDHGAAGRSLTLRERARFMNED